MNLIKQETPVDYACYGKRPASGDFIQYGLDAQFTEQWYIWCGEWLQTLRSLYPNDWLKRYLSSPSWVFAVRDSQLSTDTWVGYMTPSLDSVGRAFPFTFFQRMISSDSIIEQVLSARIGVSEIESIVTAFLKSETVETRQLLEQAMTVIWLQSSRFDNVDNRPDVCVAEIEPLDTGGFITQINIDRSAEGTLLTLLEKSCFARQLPLSVWLSCSDIEIAESAIFEGLPDPVAFARLQSQWEIIE